MKTDIEIANDAQLETIDKIAKKAGISPKLLEQYGNFKAKVDFTKLDNQDDGKLILVTAINPTKAGEGKSTTTIGLNDALCALDYNSMVALREPSMGPVFGLKGGATGGGYAQVVPMEDINLHFTGDMHAISACNNLISACLDNSIYQGNPLNIDPDRVVWKRVMDMNDRTLRSIEIGKDKITNGVERRDGFDISVASEVMACLCLASDLMDLKRRLSKMLIAYTYDNKPVYVSDLQIEDALTIIMKDAIKPNLVQSLENNPVLIHGGPFANIAHGCNSLIATKTALNLADYVVTEAGFGADLGAEKFLDIKCRFGNLQPNAVVIVATIRALKLHGGVEADKLDEPNVEAMIKGCDNLAKHIDTIKQFQLPYVVALNLFRSDSDEETQAFKKWCDKHNHQMSLSEVYTKGSQGAIDLAKKVVQLCGENNNYQPLYNCDEPIMDKLEVIAQKVYGASGVELSDKAQEQLANIEANGWDNLAICMAKTPNSLSDDAKLLGRPKNFKIHINEFRVSLGAGFIVCLSGNVLTMPGLPKEPNATKMHIDQYGVISGLS